MHEVALDGRNVVLLMGLSANNIEDGMVVSASDDLCGHPGAVLM